MIDVHGVCHAQDRGQQAGADGPAIQLVTPAGMYSLRCQRQIRPTTSASWKERQCAVCGQPDDRLLTDHIVLPAVHDVTDVVKECSSTEQPLFDLAQPTMHPSWPAKDLTRRA